MRCLELTTRRQYRSRYCRQQKDSRDLQICKLQSRAVKPRSRAGLTLVSQKFRPNTITGRSKPTPRNLGDSNLRAKTVLCTASIIYFATTCPQFLIQNSVSCIGEVNHNKILRTATAMLAKLPGSEDNDRQQSTAVVYEYCRLGITHM